jgi:hypothetical protein
MRTILVHLNVAVPDDDKRTPDEIANLVEDSLTVGLEGSALTDGWIVEIPMVDEI